MSQCHQGGFQEIQGGTISHQIDTFIDAKPLLAIAIPTINKAHPLPSNSGNDLFLVFVINELKSFLEPLAVR
jgi:hypothetical protein